MMEPTPEARRTAADAIAVLIVNHAACGYCDGELTGRDCRFTERYGVVCFEHIERGEIEPEAQDADPDSLHEIMRDAVLDLT